MHEFAYSLVFHCSLIYRESDDRGSGQYHANRNQLWHDRLDDGNDIAHIDAYHVYPFSDFGDGTALIPIRSIISVPVMA